MCEIAIEFYSLIRSCRQMDASALTRNVVDFHAIPQTGCHIEPNRTLVVMHEYEEVELTRVDQRERIR